jgi:hypothetical protein
MEVGLGLTRRRLRKGGLEMEYAESKKEDIRLEIRSIFIRKESNCFPRSSSSSCTSDSVDVRLDRLWEI